MKQGDKLTPDKAPTQKQLVARKRVADSMKMEANQKCADLMALADFVEQACLAIHKVEGKARNVTGWMVCPRCKCRLNYRIHPNGHVHGACETPDCLQWAS